MKDPWQVIHQPVVIKKHSGYRRERIRSIYSGAHAGDPGARKRKMPLLTSGNISTKVYFGENLGFFRLRKRKRRLPPQQTLVGTFKKKLSHWTPKKYLARFPGRNAVFGPTGVAHPPNWPQFFLFLLTFFGPFWVKILS